MDNSIDQQFVEFIVKALVGKPDAVKIDRSIDEKGVLLELTVDPEDLGRVIGKRGATAQSLRTLLRALGTKNDARYNLKIIDNGVAPPRREYDDHHQGDHHQQENTDHTEGGWSSSNAPANDDDNASTKKAPVDDSTSAEDEDDHSSVVSKTRKELEDLDDLDV